MQTGPINRRDFIQSSLILSASLMSLPAFSKTPKYKMGLQLFSIRDAMASDLTGTLKKVAAMGYEDLETYGYEPAAGKYYGLPSAEFKKLLDSNHLTTSSGHYDFAPFLDMSADDLKVFVDQCITGAKALDQRYITWPWLNPESRTLDKFKLLSTKLNMIGEQVNKAGLGFAYHNHNFEFVDHEGQTGYDIILRDTEPKLVKLQIDLYWAAYSGINPRDLFDKQPGRFVMWHIKDMHKISRDYTELGNGSIDFVPILPEASRAGLQYYFLEQGGNFAKSSLQSVEESANYFKKNLQKYL